MVLSVYSKLLILFTKFVFTSGIALHQINNMCTNIEYFSYFFSGASSHNKANCLDQSFIHALYAICFMVVGFDNISSIKLQRTLSEDNSLLFVSIIS